MASYQIFPVVEPILSGDVTTVGSTAKVVGLDGLPIEGYPPVDHDVLTFVAADNAWEPKAVSAGIPANISVNGVAVSSDALILVNTAFALGPDDLDVLVNGA